MAPPVYEPDEVGVEPEVRMGRIDGNLNLSRAIGDIAHKKNVRLQLHEQAITSLPDIKVHQITSKTDFAIMGCDGIWETKTSQ